MSVFDQFPKPVWHFIMDEQKPGQTAFSNDYREQPRPLGCFAYVVGGEATYVTNDHTFTLREGNILFIPVGGRYISYWSPPPVMYALMFEMRLPVDAKNRHPVQCVSAQDGDLADFSTAMRQSDINFPLIACFYRICARHWDTLLTVPHNPDIQLLPAVRWLEANVTVPTTVGALAQMCHLSESRFYSRFHTATGTSPMEYRRRLLIMEAQRLLTESTMPITEIAFSLGFESETYFRRTFHASVGMSPREYRKSGYKM